jgi:hypothetical protein
VCVCVCVSDEMEIGFVWGFLLNLLCCEGSDDCIVATL